MDPSFAFVELVVGAVVVVMAVVGWIVFCPGRPSSCPRRTTRMRVICRSLLVLQGISRSVVVGLLYLQGTCVSRDWKSYGVRCLRIRTWTSTDSPLG